MEQEYAYEKVTVNVVRDGSAGRYVIGAVLDGAFVPFATAKLGGVEKKIQAAADAKSSKSSKSSSS